MTIAPVILAIASQQIFFLVYVLEFTLSAMHKQNTCRDMNVSNKSMHEHTDKTTLDPLMQSHTKTNLCKNACTYLCRGVLT